MRTARFFGICQPRLPHSGTSLAPRGRQGGLSDLAIKACVAEDTQVRYIHVCIMSSEARCKDETELSIPAGKKRSRARAPLPARSRTRQTERTRATRRKLLDAAKRIFAQDGFEAARLEDIAAGAGYTRGAFYANFKSKEDIFFALFEEWVRERIESFTSAVRRHSDPAEKLAALRTHYAEQATDRRLVLISMEFKLFALRHPEAHARLRNRHRRIRASFGELFSEIMSALGKTHSD